MLLVRSVGEEESIAWIGRVPVRVGLVSDA